MAISIFFYCEIHIFLGEVFLKKICDPGGYNIAPYPINCAWWAESNDTTLVFLSHREHPHTVLSVSNRILKRKRMRNDEDLENLIGYHRKLKISLNVFFYFEKLFARATIHVSKVGKWPIQYSHWSLYFIMDPSDIYIIEKGKRSAFKRYKNFGGKLQFLI